MLGRGAITRAATEASIGKTWYLPASVTNFSRSSLTLLRVRCGDVVGLIEVLAQIIQLKHLVVSADQGSRPRRPPTARGSPSCSAASRHHRARTVPSFRKYCV